MSAHWQLLQRNQTQQLHLKRQILEAFDPQAALRRGYAIARAGGVVLRSGKSVASGDKVSIELADAVIDAAVKKVTIR
jgi:exonuclease VII large subunit